MASGKDLMTLRKDLMTVGKDRTTGFLREHLRVRVRDSHEYVRIGSVWNLEDLQCFSMGCFIVMSFISDGFMAFSWYKHTVTG